MTTTTPDLPVAVLKKRGLGVQATILFEEAKLPADPNKTIGQTFCFICTSKDWRGTVIIGSIAGFTADSQGIDMHISVPDINGMPISHLSYNRTYGDWVMYLPPKTVEGELILFV